MYVHVYVRKNVKYGETKRAMAKYLLVSSWEFALSDHGREGGVLPFHFQYKITKHRSIMNLLLNRLSFFLFLFHHKWYFVICKIYNEWYTHFIIMVYCNNFWRKIIFRHLILLWYEYFCNNVIENEWINSTIRLSSSMNMYHYMNHIRSKKIIQLWY